MYVSTIEEKGRPWLEGSSTKGGGLVASMMVNGHTFPDREICLPLHFKLANH